MSRKFSLRNVLNNSFLYWSYQRLVGGHKARRLFIENMVKPIKGNKILDIGCGPGNIIEFLPEVDYYGFDTDINYIASAIRNYGNKGTFVCATMNAFTVPNPGTFDIVIASGIIHHLNDDEAKKLFQAASKALKPNGRLVTLDGCFVSGQNRISHFLLKYDRGQYVRKQKEYEDLALKFFSNIKLRIEKQYFHIPYTLLIMDCENDRSLHKS